MQEQISVGDGQQRRRPRHIRNRLLASFSGLLVLILCATALSISALYILQRALDDVVDEGIVGASTGLELSQESQRLASASFALQSARSLDTLSKHGETMRLALDALDTLAAKLAGPHANTEQIARLRLEIDQLRTVARRVSSTKSALIQVGLRNQSIIERMADAYQEANSRFDEAVTDWRNTVLNDIDLDGEIEADQIREYVNGVTTIDDLRGQVSLLREFAWLIERADTTATVVQAAKRFRDRLSEFDIIAGETGRNDLAIQRGMAAARRIIISANDIEKNRLIELQLEDVLAALQAEQAIHLGGISTTVRAVVASIETSARGTADSARETLNRTAMALAAIVLFSLGGAAFMLTVVVHRGVLKPLQDLTDNMLSIASGKLDLPLPKSGRDEIGQMTAALRIFRDTEREVRETNMRELAETRRQLNAAIETIPAGFSLYDQNDRLLVFNSAYRTLSYPNAGSIIASGVHFEDVIAEEQGAHSAGDSAVDSQAWAERRLAARSAARGPAVEQWPDGRWIQTIDLKTEDGLTVSTYSDITELHHSREVAVAANRAKSTFLATMSHEIRTPMNGVVGLLELLKLTDLNSSQREMVDQTNESALALLTIIDDILDFSKIEAGQLSIETVDCSIRDICESVVSVLLPKAEEKGLDFGLLVAHHTPDAIRADPVRVRQVLFNLVGNAIKFTSQGSVVVRVDRSSVRSDEQVVIFSVEDTGIGIPRDRIKSLFSAFSQAETSTTREFGGTGLGLSISERLASKMGGGIDVRSELGRGSTFTFSMPLVPGKASGTTDGNPIDLAGVAVLVVSERPVLREAVSALLVERGAKALGVANTAEATAALNTEFGRIDVIVYDTRLDIGGLRRWLPDSAIDVDESGQYGLGICQLVRDAPEKPAPRFVGRALRRRPFWRAVGIVSGRLSSDAPDNGEVGQRPLDASRPPKQSEVRAGVRQILVAEDDDISRSLIRRQISMLGYAADTARNGKEALDMWKNGSYGLVLTDCHMPVLDGFGLTAAIREEEAAHGDHTPIVALTASAMNTEEERCLNAGMDGFIAKPVRLATLDKILSRWVPAGRDASENPQT